MVLLAAALLLIACRPDPALAGLAPPEGREPPVTRLIVQRGEERTLVTTADGPPTQTPVPTPLVRPTASPTAGPPTRTPTRTATATPTAPRTTTPRATATPRPNPDLVDAVSRFQEIERLRAHTTGQRLNLTQSYDGPSKMRTQMAEPEYLEAITVDDLVWARQGSYWRPLPDPPEHLLDRADAVVETLARLRRPALKANGVQRARAGRCYEWEVTDSRPREPTRFCLGAADNLPYRVHWQGLVIEYFDFDADVEVPEEPFPIRE